ncbi:lasso RiPP family leader peptide-containing protein [Kitasatospora sp. NPDC050543]
MEQNTEIVAVTEVFTTPEVADLGEVSEVTLGSGGFNNPDHTMYYQG